MTSESQETSLPQVESSQPDMERAYSLLQKPLSLAQKSLRHLVKKANVFTVQKMIRRARSKRDALLADESKQTSDVTESIKTRVEEINKSLEEQLQAIKAVSLDGLTTAIWDNVLRQCSLLEPWLSQLVTVSTPSNLEEQRIKQLLSTKALSEGIKKILLDLNTSIKQAIKEATPSDLSRKEIMLNRYKKVWPKRTPKQRREAAKRHLQGALKQNMQQSSLPVEESLFMDSLAGAASDNESDVGDAYDEDGNLMDPRSIANAKQRKADKQAKAKNRMGQRARRELWEKMHGDKAKHVLTAKEEAKEKQQQQKQQKPLKNPMKSVSKPPSQPSVNEAHLHPSWQAKLQQQRAVANATQAASGTKIVFNDDD